MSEGLFPLFGCLGHALKKDARAFYWRRFAGTINFPPPGLLGSPSPLHDERIVGWVKYFTHELLDGDGRVKFQTRDTTESFPSASAPKTDEQAARQSESRNAMIRMSPQPDTGEVLAGLVERVTYHNAENGFCVLRARARGHRDVVTVVGHAAAISAGEWIMASGQWVNDRTHGQQFKARFLRTSAPTSADGIERYLSSGMIRGVGPVYAKKLVRAFGEKVFDVIESSPDRLREVDGIGPVRAASILTAWAEQKAVREIMVFLHSHGVSTARAVRIFKTYGADAIQVMTDNPYRLARDIRGIGFKSADAIAMKVGIEKTAMVRVRAGVSYALAQALDDGHCGLPTADLLPLAATLLDVPADLVGAALDLEL